MPKIELTKEQRAEAIEKIMEYFNAEYDDEIGNLQAMLFLDFILDNIGPFIYNEAVKDAVTFVNSKLEDIYEITF